VIDAFAGRILGWRTPFGGIENSGRAANSDPRVCPAIRTSRASISTYA